MKRLKIVFDKIFDIIEVYLPMMSFIVVFISYVIMIIYRYFLYESIDWLFELNMIAFVWSSIFAASYGGRTGKHIMFTLIYDKFSENKKTVIRLIGSLFTVVIFSLILPKTLESLIFISMKKSSIMQLPFSVLYLPFLLFIVLTIIYYLIQFVKDIKHYIDLRKGKTKP
jgi:TRAP-type C4-dicarboxylate transport system permease small subunit